MKTEKSYLRSLGGFGLAVMVLALGSTFRSAGAGSHNPCAKPGNLTQNCGFDAFVDHWRGEKRYEVPAGWSFYVLEGDLDSRPSVDTYWGAPSLWLLSEGVVFTAGVYQQVPVTPGVVYQADLGWAAVTDRGLERRVGLDPTGGTDPLAPTVIWGPSEWDIASWPDLTVSARAAGPTMTVFAWVHGTGWIFIDALGVWPDYSQPAATLTPKPTPTPTRKPTVVVQAVIPPTRSSTPTPSPVPTETPTSSPTATPTATPTSTPTSTPTKTSTPMPPTVTPFPTRTPLPTVAVVAKVAATPGASSEMGLPLAKAADSGSGQVFLFVALSALVAGLILAVVLGWLWLRGSRGGEKVG